METVVVLLLLLFIYADILKKMKKIVKLTFQNND